MFIVRFKERRQLDNFRCVDCPTAIVAEKIFIPEGTSQMYLVNNGYVTKVVSTEDIIQIKEAL